MYTSHGHHIPGTDRTGLQPLRARCGGLERCETCLREAAKVLVKNERNHHHILIALTPQNAPEDQKIRGLLTNAIAWTFFGSEGEEKVEVTQEQADRAKIAAERCMVALREYERISGESLRSEEREDGGLVAHARRELELLGEEPEVIEWMVKTVRAFASYGHSGGSSSVLIPMLNDLLNYQNLTQLTDNPEDWIDQSGISGTPLWQNRRRSDAFSEDGGKTYTLLNSEDRTKTYTSQLLTTAHKESDEPSVRGGSEGESTSDEQEPTQLGSGPSEEASETPEEGLV